MRPLIRTCAFARITAFVALVVASAPPAYAQLGSLRKKAQEALQNKAQQKADEQLSQLADKLVPSSFNSIFGDPDSSTGPARSGSSSDAATAASGSGGGARAIPFIPASNTKTEDSYTFTAVTTVEIESASKSGKSGGKAVMMMHFNPGERYTGTRIINTESNKPDGDAFIIFDLKNEAMVMLMTSDKSKFSVAYGWHDALKYGQESADTQREPVKWDTVSMWKNYKKIGTKTIAGYAADGYRAESDKGSVEIWLSHDPSLGFGTIFGANATMKQVRGVLPPEYPTGMLLEVTSVDKTSGDTGTMRVTEINKSAHVTVSMADYPRVDMKKK